MKKKRIIWLIIPFIVVCVGFVSHYIIQETTDVLVTEQVTVLEVKDEKIIVRNYSGDEEIAIDTTTKLLSNLIEENKDYYIHYHYNFFKRPTLKLIDPI